MFDCWYLMLGFSVCLGLFGDKLVFNRVFTRFNADKERSPQPIVQDMVEWICKTVSI